MKRPISFLCLFLLTATVVKSDIIYLKNGKQIECDSAWEEGKTVKYTIAQGTAGIPKSMVAKIVKTEPKKKEPVLPPELQAQANTSVVPAPGSKEKLEKQLSSDPTAKGKLAGVYTSEGMAALRNKDLTLALEQFRKAYSYSKTKETAFNLALLYFTVKDDFNAELYFNEVLKLHPRDTETLNYLGEIAWRNEKLDEAESYWKQSLSIKADAELSARLSSVKKEKKASNSYDDATSRHFLIKYDGGAADPILVRDVNEYLEDEYRTLSSLFDVYPSTPFIVVLYPQKDYFNITDAPLWSAGANDGKIKLPVRGISTLNDELKNVLTHELAHSFVDYKTSGACPSWLQEGLAQYAEGKRVGSNGVETLQELVALKSFPSFAALQGSFSSADSPTAAALYLISLAFTEYLLERFPDHRMNELLTELGGGAGMTDAFQEAFGLPLPRVEEDWKASLTR